MPTPWREMSCLIVEGVDSGVDTAPYAAESHELMDRRHTKISESSRMLLGNQCSLKWPCQCISHCQSDFQFK